MLPTLLLAVLADFGSRFLFQALTDLPNGSTFGAVIINGGILQQVMEVVIDTNVWLLYGRRKWDVLKELAGLGFTPVLLSSVEAELAKLSKGNSETAHAAKLVTALIRRKALKTTPGSADYADTAILAYCRSHGAIAATQDALLRRELRRVGIPVVTFHRSGKITTEDTHVLQAQSSRPHPRTA